MVSFDLRILQTCLRVSYAAWPADIALGRVNSHSRTRCSLKQLLFGPQTVIFFIKESWKVSNSHYELSFSSSGTKSWKFCPSCCQFVKNLWRSIVMFCFGLQYSENFSNTDASLSSPGLSKLKVLKISLPFCPIQVNKTEILTLSFFTSFSVAVRHKSKYFNHSFQPWETFLSNKNDYGGSNLSIM